MSPITRMTILTGLLLGAAWLPLFHGETAGDSTDGHDRKVRYEASGLIEEANTVKGELLKAVKSASRPKVFFMQQALLRLTAGQAYLEMALDMSRNEAHRPHDGRPLLLQSIETLRQDVEHARSVLGRENLPPGQGGDRGNTASEPTLASG